MRSQRHPSHVPESKESDVSEKSESKQSHTRDTSLVVEPTNVQGTLVIERSVQRPTTGKTPLRPRPARRRTEISVPPVPPELRCQYKGKLCRNERTYKDDGDRHSLCELHRQRANANQRRWQKKHQHEARRRRTSTNALPYTRRRDPSQGLLLDNEDDDWIDPLFDHLIAKMEATSNDAQPR